MVKKAASADGGAKAAYRSAIKGLVTEILMIAAALTLTFTFLFGIHIQKGNGMYPAIKDGDIVLYYRPGALFNTEAVVYEADGKTLTGRIAASEGTRISASGDRQMTFDGNYLPISREDGIYDRTYAAETEALPLTVEDGCYFILGDDRDSAEDSRTLGQISRKQIKGRIVSVLRRRQI